MRPEQDLNGNVAFVSQLQICAPTLTTSPLSHRYVQNRFSDSSALASNSG